jgi:hypothetical protein
MTDAQLREWYEDNWYDENVGEVVRALIAEVRRLRAEACQRAADELTREAQRLGMYDRPALTWSPEPPKEAGWYWCRLPDRRTPLVREVYLAKGSPMSYPDTLWVDADDGPEPLAEFHKGRLWAGPLSPPPLPAEPLLGAPVKPEPGKGKP